MIEEDEDDQQNNKQAFEHEKLAYAYAIKTNNPRANEFREQLDAGQDQPYCIHKVPQFLANEAFAYYDNEISPLRAFKPRRYLTEQYNGRPCIEDVTEEYVWMDFYLFRERRKLSKQDLKNNEDVADFDDFEKVTGMIRNYHDESSEFVSKRVKLGIKGKFPEIGDEITFYAHNIHKSDYISVRKFKGTVMEVKRGKATINWENLNISKDPKSKNFGLVLIHVDLFQYSLNRSIVFPPKIPQHVSLKMY